MAYYESQNECEKNAILAMMVALGVVLSPILRVPGHGPHAAFYQRHCCRFAGTVVRPRLRDFNRPFAHVAHGRQPVGGHRRGVWGGALRAALSATGKMLAAVAGEIVGTGIIGAMASYPVMAFLYHMDGVVLFTYVPSFLAGTIIGGFAGYLFLIALSKNGLLTRLQRMANQ